MTTINNAPVTPPPKAENLEPPKLKSRMPIPNTGTFSAPLKKDTLDIDKKLKTAPTQTYLPTEQDFQDIQQNDPAALNLNSSAVKQQAVKTSNAIKKWIIAGVVGIGAIIAGFKIAPIKKGAINLITNIKKLFNSNSIKNSVKEVINHSELETHLKSNTSAKIKFNNNNISELDDVVSTIRKKVNDIAVDTNDTNKVGVIKIRLGDKLKGKENEIASAIKNNKPISKIPNIDVNEIKMIKLEVQSLEKHINAKHTSEPMIIDVKANKFVNQNSFKEQMGLLWTSLQNFWGPLVKRN